MFAGMKDSLPSQRRIVNLRQVVRVSSLNSPLSMHIIYLCQYFVPEPAAPSARVAELSRCWVRAGHNVTVLTAMPNHPTGILSEKYRGRLLARESLDGITVLRNWIYATPNHGFAKKTLNHLSFMHQAQRLPSQHRSTALFYRSLLLRDRRGYYLIRYVYQ